MPQTQELSLFFCHTKFMHSVMVVSKTLFENYLLRQSESLILHLSVILTFF